MLSRSLCAFPCIGGVALGFVLSITNGCYADAVADAETVIEKSGLRGGFIVHLNPTDGEFTAALRRNSGTQVQALVVDALQLERLRGEIRARSTYGEVAADSWSGRELPYIDNLVNLLVIDGEASVDESECMRVLVPNGVLLRRQGDTWVKTVKPRPDNIDDWTHYLHDPTGNAVAHDDVVAPPRHLQWVGSPRWSRHHDRMASMSACVSGGGRLFYIMDEGSRISIQLPPKWKVIARDAFNGTILWKRDIANWQSHLWPLKSGPTQLSRRLVAGDGVVYATLDINAPLVALDAATGETKVTYAGSDATEEILHLNGTLFLVVRKGEAELANYAPLHGRVGDQAVARDMFWNEEPRVIMAFDAGTGKPLWARQTKVSPLTMAAGGSDLFFHDGAKIVALDQTTGELKWESQPVTRRQAFTFNFGPRLVVQNDVVLYAGGDGKMFSLDGKTGRQLWTAEHPNSGYQSPQDLIVMKGLVWCAPLTTGKDTGQFTGRDLQTGEIKQQFTPDVSTYWFHHRCYIAKATDKFLIPSRTGVEFVDPSAEHWDIHHWVRGGCLYGVMPCNGLTYTPPHDCACYPEAKLYGFNALAPASATRPTPGSVPEQGRLERGPAYGVKTDEAVEDRNSDWPTFRHDANRSGVNPQEVAEDIGPRWTVEPGGQLTPPVIASGTVYLARSDAHTLFAFDEPTGKAKWSYTIGARIDSPPTFARGRVVFGGTDGWVYCLTARDGQLIWRYRAAPMDRRMMAYEQLESVWPVHGSVLVRENQVYAVAGRSIFLDGGLRLVRLNLETGEKLSETIMDDKNPETGNNMQEKLMTLQMPVGLPDILSCDGNHIFMKSQKFDLEGNRIEIGPNSGEFVKQVLKQRGPDAHIFAPMGFLDDSWFHRSYWVLGQSFAGGHAGYYQAGRFAPSGRILVNGNGYVFGYGRKPEYLRWTTTLEHQLFAADPEPPEVPVGFVGGGQNAASTPASYAQFPNSASLNPKGKPITVEAWISATKPNGVIVARGGPAEGFALSLEKGVPTFSVRAASKLTAIRGDRRIIGGWHHVLGALTEDRKLRLYVDGKLAAEGQGDSLLTKDPAQNLEIAADLGTAVGQYESPNAFGGIIDEVRLHWSTFSDEAITTRFERGEELADDAALAVTFDDGSARDLSTNRNNGTVEGGRVVEGKFGQAVLFTGSGANKPGNAGGAGDAKGSGESQASSKAANKANTANASSPPQQGNTLVKPKWNNDVPIYVRGMVLTALRLFIVGPPDIIDEEQTFQQLSEKDPAVQELLARQDDAIEGKQGGLLIAIDGLTGKEVTRVKMDSLPVWDGMASANGALFISTLDGKLICLGKR